MIVDGRRALLFASVLVVFFGFAFVVRPFEAAIATRYDDLDTTRTALARHASLRRSLPVLERERRQREKHVDRFHLADARPRLVTRLLDELDSQAARNDVVVETMTAAEPLPAPAGPASAGYVLDEIPFDVLIRGSYRDVIRVVRDLDGSDVAADIEIRSLRAAPRLPGAPFQIDAGLHLILFRGADETTRPSSSD
jgi:hypothetical protein